MNSCILGFQEIDQAKLAMVGGKGANLGELSRIDGIRVPEGFCVTTEAYKRSIGQIRANQQGRAVARRQTQGEKDKKDDQRFSQFCRLPGIPQVCHDAAFLCI
jgi:phosphoenolpyruvate synthase/pyruvate phosphate dikinase